MAVRRSALRSCHAGRRPSTSPPTRNRSCLPEDGPRLGSWPARASWSPMSWPPSQCRRDCCRSTTML
jgi:hypothetical protein